MSTRFPAPVDLPLIDAPFKKEMHVAKTNWKLIKPRLLDAVFIGMILVSILGLAYAWLR